MKKVSCGSILCGLLAVTLAGTACGRPGEDKATSKLTAVALVGESYCEVKEAAGKRIEAVDLWTIREGDPEVKPGAFYEFEVGMIAESYPPQTRAEKWTKLADQPGPFEANFNLGQSIRFHLGDTRVKLLDVRTPEEYGEGHLAGSINLPLAELAGRMSEVLPDKEQVVLVYCRSGNRSAEAAKQLAEAGYPLVFDLGGILDYEGELETA